MAAPDERPVLPDQTSDEIDAGWNDEPDRDEDDRRLRDEVPPHHHDRGP